MAEDLSNVSMELLLTELIQQVKNIGSFQDIQEPGDRVDLLLADLEETNSELKSSRSDWKIATQQAEDGAKVFAAKNDELEERRKQMAKEEEQLSRRTSDLEAKERLFEENRADLEKKEKLLQQRSVDLEQAERINREEQARLRDEATLIESDKSDVVQAYSNLKVKTDAAAQVENGLRRREATIKLITDSALALNELVNNNLAAMKKELDEDKKVKAAIVEKHRRMKKLRENLLNISESCTKGYDIIQASARDIANFEAGKRETLAGLREDVTSLSTALDKRAQEARGVAKEIDVAGKDLESLVTSTERQLHGISSKIGNVTEVSIGLDEVSAKFQQFQPTMDDTLRELTEALSKAQAAASKAEADAAKARADAAKAQADSRRTQVD